jgi:hypothetical protein
MILNQRKFGDYWFFSTIETKKHLLGKYDLDDKSSEPQSQNSNSNSSSGKPEQDNFVKIAPANAKQKLTDP